MSTFNTLFLTLTALACVSPLLTLLHLWQMKEWRWDRLLDHLKTEGIFITLVGKARYLIGALWLLNGLLVFAFMSQSTESRDLFFSIWMLILPVLLVILGTLQWFMKKQPMPVWTRKAELMFVVSILLTIGAGVLVMIYTSFGFDKPENIIKTNTFAWITTLLPYLGSFFVVLSWLLLRPIDLFLKNRILARAKALRASHPHLIVIGITGSVGKTTTKELIHHLLKDKGAIATPLHVNTEMGVAGWLSSVLKDEPYDSTRILVVEMGAYRIGEIALLCEIAQPTIGVVTFVGKQHSGLFGGEEAIAKAKGELVAHLPKNGHAFVNADSPLIDLLLKESTVNPITIGSGTSAQIVALDIEETGKGVRFTTFDTTFDVPLAGTHNVTNILLAIATAKHLGVGLPEIRLSLRNFTAFERTFSVRREHGITILDNSYNSSAESAEAGIDWAKRQPNKEKILVMSGIIELGNDEERVHRMIAEKAVKVFQKVYITQERFLTYFKPFFGERASLVSAKKQPLSSGALLVCMGRMSGETIERFMPEKNEL